MGAVMAVPVGMGFRWRTEQDQRRQHEQARHHRPEKGARTLRHCHYLVSGKPGADHSLLKYGAAWVNVYPVAPVPDQLSIFQLLEGQGLIAALVPKASGYDRKHGATAERTGLPIVQSGDLVWQQAEAELAEAALAGNALLQPLGPIGSVEDKITCHDMALSRCFDITDIVPPYLCCNAQ
jgi:hypothetical protein